MQAGTSARVAGRRGIRAHAVIARALGHHDHLPPARLSPAPLRSAESCRLPRIFDSRTSTRGQLDQLREPAAELRGQLAAAGAERDAARPTWDRERAEARDQHSRADVAGGPVTSPQGARQPCGLVRLVLIRSAWGACPRADWEVPSSRPRLVRGLPAVSTDWAHAPSSPKPAGQWRASATACPQLDVVR